MSNYEKHRNKLQEMWEDNCGSLTSDMVIEYMQDQGMLANLLDAEVDVKPPRECLFDEESKNELRKVIMRSFGGWYNYEIVEYLEWLINWNKRKAKESAAEHRRFSD